MTSSTKSASDLRGVCVGCTCSTRADPASGPWSLEPPGNLVSGHYPQQSRGFPPRQNPEGSRRARIHQKPCERSLPSTQGSRRAGTQGGVARQRPSPFTAREAGSSPVSCNSAQYDVPDWVKTYAVQPTFWDSDSFSVKCHSQQLAPNRSNLGGGSVWDVVVQPSPDL